MYCRQEQKKKKLKQKIPSALFGSRSFCLCFSLEGKQSGQITKILEAEAIRLVDIAVQKKKPIVLEALDTTLSKSAGRYRNRKQNQRMSMFAYKKMQDSIHKLASRWG